MRKLTKEDERVLRILRDEPAHELVHRPLRAPAECLRRGWAEHGQEYGTFLGGRPARARTIHITDAGRAALAEQEKGDA